MAHIHAKDIGPIVYSLWDWGTVIHVNKHDIDITLIELYAVTEFYLPSGFTPNVGCKPDESNTLTVSNAIGWKKQSEGRKDYLHSFLVEAISAAPPAEWDEARRWESARVLTIGDCGGLTGNNFRRFHSLPFPCNHFSFLPFSFTRLKLYGALNKNRSCN